MTTQTQTQIRIPISTLTGLPCPHGPGKECDECVGEGGFRFDPLVPCDGGWDKPHRAGCSALAEQPGEPPWGFDGGEPRG